VFLLQAIRKRFLNLGSTLYDVRNQISRAEKSTVMYNQFFQELTQLVPDIHNLLSACLQTHLEFLKLDGEVSTKEPVFALWLYLLKLAFEKPILIMQKEDDKDGSLANIIRTSLSLFICSCMPLPSFTLSLTDAHLAQQTQ